MSAVSTIVVSIAAAAGAVALYRFVGERTQRLKEVFAESRKRARAETRTTAVIDFERDPDTGVFRPKT